MIVDVEGCAVHAYVSCCVEHSASEQVESVRNLGGFYWNSKAVAPVEIFT